jgi:hypothetical protein
MVLRLLDQALRRSREDLVLFIGRNKLCDDLEAAVRRADPADAHWRRSRSVASLCTRVGRPRRRPAHARWTTAHNAAPASARPFLHSTPASSGTKRKRPLAAQRQRPRILRASNKGLRKEQKTERGDESASGSCNHGTSSHESLGDQCSLRAVSRPSRTCLTPHATWNRNVISSPFLDMNGKRRRLLEAPIDDRETAASAVRSKPWICRESPAGTDSIGML